MRINKIESNYFLNNNYQKKSQEQKTNNVNYQSIPSFYAYYPRNISFRGGYNWPAIAEFTNDMGKRIYSKRNVVELARKHPNSSGITEGRGIPKVWTSRIKDIANFDKDAFMTKFGEIFSKEREYADVDFACEKLKNLFIENGIIDKDTPFSLKYIGHGFQAWAYKIAIDNDDNNAIVTKLFKRNYNYLQNHGNYTEQNLAEYIKNYGGDKTEFTKYYYGDTKNGYMVTEYIPDDVDYPKDKIDLSDIGVGYDDYFPKNVKRGHIIDFGGIITVNNLVGNKTAQEVYKNLKYGKNEEEKIALINDVLNVEEVTEEIKDKAIGVVHGIKFLPEEKQADLYLKAHKLNSHRVNIALEQNFDGLNKYDETKPLIETLIKNAIYDYKEEETIAKEIKHVPDKLRHEFFENYQNTHISAIIKYLARNLNQYYKNMNTRREIYENFIENSDRYASIALINSMVNVDRYKRDEYFEKFFAKEDPIINTTLARSLELLNDNPSIQLKWINKLSECKNVQIIAGLAESLEFIEPKNRPILLEKILPTKDRVAKEFIAKNIAGVPGSSVRPDWIEQLLENSDNMVKATLANTTSNIQYDFVKRQWSAIIMRDADDTVKQMLKAIIG